MKELKSGISHFYNFEKQFFLTYLLQYTALMISKFRKLTYTTYVTYII